MLTEATVPHSRGAWKKPFNAHRIEGDVAFLVITNARGEFKCEVMIDAADLELVSNPATRWCTNRDGYAARMVGRTVSFLHRLLLDPAKEMEVDHINRNRLDNRRCNLREVTKTVNRQNCGPNKHSKTGVRGVLPYSSKRFPFLVQVGARPVLFALKVRTLNIGRITASLARAQHWGAEAA